MARPAWLGRRAVPRARCAGGRHGPGVGDGMFRAGRGLAQADGHHPAAGLGRVQLHAGRGRRRRSPRPTRSPRQVTGGTLDTVTLANPEGKSVTGEFDTEKTTWTNTEPLGYDKSYTLTVVGTGEDGKQAEETPDLHHGQADQLHAALPAGQRRATCSTAAPSASASRSWSGSTSRSRTGPTAERSLSVTTTPAVEGAWRWMDNREVHWRPKEYWPAGTKVTVEANVYGKNLGERAVRPGEPQGVLHDRQVEDRHRRRGHQAHEGVHRRRAGDHDQRPGRHRWHPDQHGQGRDGRSATAGRPSTTPPTAARTSSRPSTRSTR